MAYFEYDGKHIYYDEFGTGIPLLFLHGNTASSMMFSEIAREYKNDYKVILIDFLGHGKSDRLQKFPADLWFYEAQQVISFLRYKKYSKVNIIGSSGGALVAINVALEAPDFVNKVIADSFEGEKPLKLFTQNVRNDRDISKQDDNSKMFYYYMHGADWEQVIDNDTNAIIEHDKEIGIFFHKPLSNIKADILLTGSRKDEFVSSVSSDYFDEIYNRLLNKIGHGKIYLFDEGGHPAMLTNDKDFLIISKKFFSEEMQSDNNNSLMNQ